MTVRIARPVRARSVRGFFVGLSLVVGLSAVVFAPARSDARSIAGQTLADGTKTDFFTFFHFKETERHAESKDETLVMYETAVSDYKVQLAVAAHGKGQEIASMVMVLPRKFVEDPKWGLFARDISKSFLRDSVADVDAAAVQTLVNEIAFGGQKDWSSTKVQEAKNSKTGEVTKDVNLVKPGASPLKKGDNAWMGQGAVPKLPATPSPGYMVFLGKQPLFEKQLSKTRIRLNNTSTDSKQYLMFNMWVTDGKGWF